MKDLCVGLPIVFGRKTGPRSKVNIVSFLYLQCKIQCCDSSKINVNLTFFCFNCELANHGLTPTNN